MKHTFFAPPLPHKLIDEIDGKLSKLFNETELKYFEVAQILKVELIDFKNTDLKPFLDLKQDKNLLVYNKMRALQVCIEFLHRANPQLEQLEHALTPYRSSAENKNLGYNNGRSGLGTSTTEELVNKTFKWIEIINKSTAKPTQPQAAEATAPVSTKAVNPLQDFVAVFSDADNDFSDDDATNNLAH